MDGVTLPLRNDLPHFKFRTELDGAGYVFEFWWNDRAGAWFMSISDTDDVMILAGVRVVVDFPLAARFHDERLPPGVLVAQDTTGARQDPGLEDLGVRTVLLYFPSSELAP